MLICKTLLPNRIGSDNRYGAYVWHGGIVLLGGATPALLGAGSHCHAGGIIAKVDGTLI